MKDSNNVVNKVDTGLSTVPTLSCSHDLRCHIVHSHDLEPPLVLLIYHIPRFS